MLGYRLLAFLGALCVAGVAFGQIRDNNGALIVPQLSGNANDVLKGDGTFGAGGGGGELPAGAIILIKSGTCPDGYVEDADLAGRTIIGTVAANDDIGTTGGADAITPAGTISAINQVINHTHTVNVTDPTHNHTQNAHTHVITSQTATTGSATSYEHGTLDTSSAETEATEVTGSTTATNQAAATGITASTANPAGGVASVTPTFTGTQFDNRSAFARVIFCQKS